MKSTHWMMFVVPIVTLQACKVVVDNGFNGEIVDQYGIARLSPFSFSIDDRSFDHTFLWRHHGAYSSADFWFWKPGLRNLCSGSTDPECRVNLALLDGIDIPDLFFTDDVLFSLEAVTKPAEKCTPPEILRDLIASDAAPSAVILCENNEYENLRTSSDEPVYMDVYFEPGVTIRDSKIKGELYIWSPENRVTIENSQWGGTTFSFDRAIINGLVLVDSFLWVTGSAKIVDNNYLGSLDFQNITLEQSDFMFGWSSINRKAFNAANADANTVTFRNINSHNSNFGVSVQDMQVVFSNTIFEDGEENSREIRLDPAKISGRSLLRFSGENILIRNGEKCYLSSNQPLTDIEECPLQDAVDL